ncbi:hypothetical protein EW146_g5984 [Bondarzewia mesenterica]|uniref:Uncharacterized protein n=1 Tax=Bondarzewia mesenterica TaxID=1095465 RepID=A0A4S4LPX9_9AGAM|nr:hypothetical protein EW146_g5984 [Bondarzewia mesenterica]
MHSSAAVAALLIAAAASPVMAIPVSHTQARSEEIDARGLSLGTIGKELGVGALGGGALAALNHFLGGGSESSSSRRDVNSNALKNILETLMTPAGEFNELATRGLPVSTILKEFGTGILGGGALTGLEQLLGGGGSGSQTSSRRALEELDARSFGSILGKLIPSAEQDLTTVLKNSVIGGLASGGVVAAGQAVEGDSNTRRALEELDARGFGSILGKLIPSAEQDLTTVLKNSVLGGLASGGVVAAGNSILGNSNSRRDLDAREPISSTGKGILGSLVGLGASSAVGPIVNEVEKLFGGGNSNARRELEDILAAREPLSSTGKGVIGSLAGLAASSLVGPVVNEIESLFRRDLDADTLVALNLLASRALNELD